MNSSGHITIAAQYIRDHFDINAPVGIVLGTGLGELASEVKEAVSLTYSEIPHFPQATVEGHDGRLIHGTLAGVEVLAMKGRFHYYEGYDMREVVFPIRVMHQLGVRTLILSNASGGMNPAFAVGDIMVIRDHINLFPSNPLIGPNDDNIGPRFPDMSEPYSKDYVRLLHDCGTDLGITLREGVYVGVSGPCYETPAEYRYLRIIGADVVGMSTVPETIAARHLGMKVAALSVVTDLGIEGRVESVSHEEVQVAARSAEPKLAAIIKSFLAKLNN